MSEKQTITVKFKVSKDFKHKDQIRHIFSGIEEIEIDTISFPLKSKTSAAKGSSFERSLAQQLSLWWSEGEDKYIFSRRGGSGGSFRDKKGASGSSGDIMADKPIGERFTKRYSIEAKFYADLTGQFWNWLAGESSKVLETFWMQTVESALPYNRYCFLILRCNNHHPIIITNDPYFSEIENTIMATLCNSIVYIIPLSKFLQLNPKMFKEGLPLPEVKEIKVRLRKSKMF